MVRRSSIVRAGVVTAMPWRLVMWDGVRVRERWIWRPGPAFRRTAAPTVRWIEPGIGRRELPERRGARVAQHRPVPRSEHSRQPSPPPGEAPMPDRIHAKVEAMQPSRVHPSSHRALVDPKCRELLTRDDSVLSSREHRQSDLRRGALLSHTESNAPRHPISPPSDRGVRRSAGDFEDDPDQDDRHDEPGRAPTAPAAAGSSGRRRWPAGALPPPARRAPRPRRRPRSSSPRGSGGPRSAWSLLTQMSRGPAARNSGASKPPDRLRMLGIRDSCSSACSISASAWLRAKPTFTSLPPPPPPPPPSPSSFLPPPPWEPREWAPRCFVASAIA